MSPLKAVVGSPLPLLPLFCVSCTQGEWLESIDEPRHRYGTALMAFWWAWIVADTDKAFFHWLDSTEGESGTVSGSCRLLPSLLLISATRPALPSQALLVCHVAAAALSRPGDAT